MASIQPRTRPGQQAHPGDVTGRKREALAREAAEADKDRQNELTMITAEKRRARDEDIIDPETREVINGSTGVVTTMDDDDEDEAPRLIGSGDTKIEELPEPKPIRAIAPGEAPQNRSQEYLNEKVIVRVNADLEEVTLGYGNTYTFQEGRRYRVPRWVAEHLEERGLTW